VTAKKDIEESEALSISYCAN